MYLSILKVLRHVSDLVDDFEGIATDMALLEGKTPDRLEGTFTSHKRMLIERTLSGWKNGIEWTVPQQMVYFASPTLDWRFFSRSIRGGSLWWCGLSCYASFIV